MSLILPSELGAYLHIELAEDDLSAAIAIDAASSAVEEYIGQSIVAPDEFETVRINGTGGTLLLLPGQPCQVNEVVVTEGDEETTLEDELDYYTDSNAGILYRVDGYVWPKGKGNIQVQMKAGREDVPPVLKMVALQIAARIFDQGLAASESMNGYSISYASDTGVGLTDSEQRILDLYRLRVKTL